MKKIIMMMLAVLATTMIWCEEEQRTVPLGEYKLDIGNHKTEIEGHEVILHDKELHFKTKDGKNVLHNLHFKIGASVSPDGTKAVGDDGINLYIYDNTGKKLNEFAYTQDVLDAMKHPEPDGIHTNRELKKMRKEEMSKLPDYKVLWKTPAKITDDGRVYIIGRERMYGRVCRVYSMEGVMLYDNKHFITDNFRSQYVYSTSIDDKLVLYDRLGKVIFMDTKYEVIKEYSFEAKLYRTSQYKAHLVFQGSTKGRNSEYVYNTKNTKNHPIIFVFDGDANLLQSFEPHDLIIKSNGFNQKLFDEYFNGGKR